MSEQASKLQALILCGSPASSTAAEGVEQSGGELLHGHHFAVTERAFEHPHRVCAGVVGAEVRRPRALEVVELLRTGGSGWLAEATALAAEGLGDRSSRGDRRRVVALAVAKLQGSGHRKVWRWRRDMVARAEGRGTEMMGGSQFGSVVVSQRRKGGGGG